MVLNEIEVARAKGDKDKIQSYWNTWHCQNSVIIEDVLMYGNYCKNRFCKVCTANRKADIINRYYPNISQWQDVQFVTLTVKAQPAKNLNTWIKLMQKAIRRILKRLNKRNERGTGAEFIGVRSLECNFNPIRRTYNPHFHIILQGKECAEILVKEWRQLWNSRSFNVSLKAQYIRLVKNLERDLVETIIYGSKIFTEIDLTKKRQMDVPRKIYAKALHNIFMAM